MESTVAVALTLLTLTLTIAGIWLILILYEIRKIVKRIDKISAKAEEATQKAIGSATSIWGVIEGIREGLRWWEKAKKVK